MFDQVEYDEDCVKCDQSSAQTVVDRADVRSMQKRYARALGCSTPSTSTVLWYLAKNGISIDTIDVQIANSATSSFLPQIHLYLRLDQRCQSELLPPNHSCYCHATVQQPDHAFSGQE